MDTVADHNVNNVSKEKDEKSSSIISSHNQTNQRATDISITFHLPNNPAFKDHDYVIRVDPQDNRITIVTAQNNVDIEKHRQELQECDKNIDEPLRVNGEKGSNKDDTLPQNDEESLVNIDDPQSTAVSDELMVNSNDSDSNNPDS